MGCISALFIKMFMQYRVCGEFTFDLISAMNGSLSGLVAVSISSYMQSCLDLSSHMDLSLNCSYLSQITAGCATLEPWAALVVGFVAGAIYLFGSDALISLRLDDAVDAIPVSSILRREPSTQPGVFSHFLSL